MTIKPLADRVLVEPKAAETKTAGGLIIPDNAKEKPSRGRVVAVGDGVYAGEKLVPVNVKEKDIVLFAKWAPSANEVKLDGKDFVLIKETDILGIIK